MSAVRVRGLVRRYGRTPILRGLDLDVEAGERLAICGANGAGKTTLVRVLAGLLRPSRGSVEVLGSSPRDLATRRRIGLLGHAPFLYPRLSAMENLRFWGGLYGVDDAGGRGAELLRRVGLDALDRRPVGEYSQGMRQRVGLARALLGPAELLLLDEPFVSLDRTGADAVQALLAEPGRTAIMATHDVQRAEAIGARIAVLEDGRLAGR